MHHFFIPPLISSSCLHLHHFNENDQIETEPSLFYTVFPLQCRRNPGLSMSAGNGKDSSFPFLITPFFSLFPCTDALSPSALPLLPLYGSCISCLINAMEIQKSVDQSVTNSTFKPTPSPSASLLNVDSEGFARPRSMLLMSA